jgi:hypothetical protein
MLQRGWVERGEIAFHVTTIDEKGNISFCTTHQQSRNLNEMFMSFNLPLDTSFYDD